jgi:hypothetical protein
VGALGHYLEREGVPTAQVSLIREQTAAIRPPRALWVPFMLGRPFGAPNEPDFQRRVLHALLSLFERSAGPVLEDYPEEAPAVDVQPEGYACPVSFAPVPAQPEALAQALRAEIAQLAPWYDLARKRRGRTTVGLFGSTVDAGARHVAAWLDAPAQPPAVAGMSAGLAVKRACDDVKAYYYEAMAAQPGSLSPQAIESWFWNETAAAKAFLAIWEACRRSDDASLRPLRLVGLVPRAVMERQDASRKDAR